MTPRNQFLLDLDRAASGPLLPYTREVALARGDTVMEEGAVAGSIVFPEGALLSAVAAMSDGRMVEVCSVGQDGAVGVLSCLTSAPEGCRTVVRVGGPARILPASILKVAAERDEALRGVLLKSIQNRAVRSEQELACNALHEVTGRLARWLLLACARTAGSRLLLTQEDMAVVLGVQRTTLNASAMYLRSLGAIRYSRGSLEVLDAARLETAACECYRHLAGDLQPVGVCGNRQVA